MHSNHDHAEGAASASPVPALTDLEAARALIAEEERQRMQACSEEIQGVLDRYGMTLEVTPASIFLKVR